MHVSRHSTPFAFVMTMATVTVAQGAFAQLPTRFVSHVDTDMNTITATPGVVFFPYTHPAVSSRAAVLDFLPGLDGVVPTSVSVDTDLEGTIDVEWVGGSTSLGSNLYLRAIETSAGSALSGSWGPLAATDRNRFVATSAVNAGQTASLSLGLQVCAETTSCSYSSTYLPGQPEWPSILAEPSFEASLTTASLRLQSNEVLSNELIAFPVTSVAVTMATTATVSVAFELDAAPLTQFCTSQPNSTGSSAFLEAFGSQVAGTDWCTIRASGLPANTFALLFSGPQPDNIPGSTSTLCVGGGLTRESGAVQAVGSHADFELDLGMRVPGETLHLQAYFRDPILGLAASNASSFVTQ